MSHTVWVISYDASPIDQIWDFFHQQKNQKHNLIIQINLNKVLPRDIINNESYLWVTVHFDANDRSFWRYRPLLALPSSIMKLTKKPFNKHHRWWNKPNNKIPSVEKSDQVFGFFSIWIILLVVIFFVHWRVQSFIFIFIKRKNRIYKPRKKLIFEL